MRAVIGQAATLRGCIITSYAHVEHLLADIVIRCQALPEYAALPKSYPHKLRTRIARVQQLLSLPGPLAQYKQQFECLLAELGRFEEIRHFMAHGLLIARVRPNQWHELRYQMLGQAKGQRVEEGRMVTDLDQLSNAAREIAQWSQQAVTLLRDIYLRHDIEHR